MRIDNRCPKGCEYRLQKNGEDALAIGRCKVDSVCENYDLNRELVDQWLLVPSQDFDQQIPLKIAETVEGREKLAHYIDRIPNNILLPLNYLRERLHLPTQEEKLPIIDYESKSNEFLELLILQKWEDTIPYLYQADSYQTEENTKIYIESLVSQPLIRKIKHYSMISSAYAKDGQEGLVFFDINHKDDLTLHWKKKDGKWLLWAKIGGNPQLIYGEKKALEHIEHLLGQQKYSQTYETLDKYSRIFQDSGDLEYHWGLYYSIQADKKKAIAHYNRAILLDQDFHQARFNMAFILHADNQLDSAQFHYEYLLKLNPKDIKVMNNLAIVALMKQNNAQAKSLWEQCLALDPDNENVAKNLEHFIKTNTDPNSLD